MVGAQKLYLEVSYIIFRTSSIASCWSELKVDDSELPFIESLFTAVVVLIFVPLMLVVDEFDKAVLVEADRALVPFD